MEDTAIGAKRRTIELLSTLGKIGCSSPDIFFKLFDAQVVAALLYAAEIGGYEKYDQKKSAPVPL